ncbi:Protein LYRIC 3D3/LYRIC [Triplophysa tibetana]|uniref:Protein LYRIC 3D3/LYRIC n=1 Tax=Triplophysa tibetana TaxID=1572043 RepID=A0A5A9N0U5_9TELE|nr:Protein LYRIC 3D3/LYRIC [Triplophysa tibetana]
MAPGWQEVVSQNAEQITGYVREILSSGLVFLKSELGIDLGLNPDVCAPWVLLLAAWIGLVLMLILWVSVCRGVSRRLTETPDTGVAPPTKKAEHTAEEPKRRNRRRNAEKKGGLAVEPQQDTKVLDTQEQLEVKADKAKKNKKKQKAPVKDKSKSSTSGGGKEPDEDTWETKVSNREKRQQRRKDKTPGDGSASPEATATSSAINTTEQVQTAPEKPVTTIKTSASTPVIQKELEAETPDIEAKYIREPVVPQVTHCWEEVLSVNGSGRNDLSIQLPPQMANVQAESWTTLSLSTEHQAAETSVWPQDMEGSWTIVDGSHIPVSFSGLTAVPVLSWGPQQPPVQVDDEWSGLNSAPADPSCDWNAPSEEWGNYVEKQSASPVPLEQPIPEVQQESDLEKEKDDAGPPGSGKAKKKKKKKTKVDDAGPSAPIQSQVKAEKDPSAGPQAKSTAGNNLAGGDASTRVEVPSRAVSSAPEQTQQRMAGPESTHKPAPVPTQKQRQLYRLGTT